MSVAGEPAQSGPAEHGTRDRGEHGDDDQHNAHALRGELLPRQDRGDQRPPDRRPSGDDAARGGPPPPGPYVEIGGGLIGHIVDDGSGRRVLHPDEPQHRTVCHVRRLQGGVQVQDTAVARHQMTCLRPHTHPVAQQPHHLGKQLPDRLLRRQHKIDSSALTNQSDPAQREPRTARYPRRYHAFEPIIG